MTAHDLKWTYRFFLLAVMLTITGMNLLWGYDARQAGAEAASLRHQLQLAEAPLLPPPAL